MTNHGDDDRETVEVTRRRRGDSGPRERAEAPSRRREGEAPPPPPSGGAGGPGGARPPTSAGPPSFGGIKQRTVRAGGIALPLPIILILLVVGCCVAAVFIYFMLQGSEEPAPLEPPIQPPTAAPTVIVTRPPSPTSAGAPTATARPTTATRPPATVAPTSGAAPAIANPTWLIMLYQDARDKILDEDIFLDLNEAERAGSNERVRIVAQLDRYRGGRTNPWTSVKRFYVTRDADLKTLRSQMLADLGQVNMSDSKTLSDFVIWAIKTYPSDRYVLILSDHGLGWPGGWTDPNRNARRTRNFPLEQQAGNLLYLHELEQALAAIRAQTGLDKFELLGLDACLMGQIEILSALAPYARYAVASEETEPALGWAYGSFLNALKTNPNMTGADLARLIVKSYVTEDQRILDDEARAQLVSGGRSASAAQVARQMEQDSTLSAIDLQKMPALMTNLNAFAVALQQADLRGVSQARSYAQAFTSIFGRESGRSYIDLGNFAKLLLRTNQPRQTVEAANNLLAALQDAVIAEKHGAGKAGATGISIYFPNSELYRSPYSGPQSYTVVAQRFARESLWDDLLLYFYTGRNFTPQDNALAVPPSGAAVRAPAAGGIQVAPIVLSRKTAAPGAPVTLSVDVDGANVGHIKFFAGFYDKAANSINVTDQDYLQSSDTRQVDGVYYPVWPASGKFTLKFAWEPTVFAINDGKRSVVALLAPQTYGATPELAVYTVDGIYTSVETGEARPARLYFRDKTLRQVLGFTGDDFTGAAREITPRPGDTFTILEQWLDLDARGAIKTSVTQRGETIAFGAQPFVWRELDAAAGDYVVGFIVEDLDGKAQAVFAAVTVQ